MTNKELIKLIAEKQFKQAEDFIFYLVDNYLKGKIPVRNIKVDMFNSHPFVYFNLLDNTRKFTVHFMRNGRIQTKFNFFMDYRRYKYDNCFSEDFTKRKISKEIYRECFLNAENSLHSYWDFKTYYYPNIDLKDLYDNAKYIARREMVKIITRNILASKGIKRFYLEMNVYGILKFHIKTSAGEYFYINDNSEHGVTFEKKIFNDVKKEILHSVDYFDSIKNGVIMKSKLEREIRKGARYFINENLKEAK